MSTEQAGTKETSPKPQIRLSSIDAYRGMVMLLMMGEVLRFGAVSSALPDSKFWSFLDFHQSHVEWIGCSLHDLIQPSFSFLVGVALPFSIANRMARGQGAFGMTLHAFWRALILIILGFFLRSIGHKQTNFTFEDTLTQIGLGYGFLFMLGFRSVRTQWLAVGVLLVGYWAAFALYPAPGKDFDYAAVGVAKDWPHLMEGFQSHWNKNSNLAWAFDTWFLNLFPREKVFTFNGGGYATLSFIPTLATMILGLIAGGLLKDEREPRAKVRRLVILGLVCLGSAWALGKLGICPVVKRIWTPSWALFSGGWCFLFLAGYYFVIEMLKLRFWSFPLLVVGANSIAAYCIAHLFDGFVHRALTTHLGEGIFKVLGNPYEPLLHGAATLFVLWLILLWMYRKKIYLKI